MKIFVKVLIVSGLFVGCLVDQQNEEEDTVVGNWKSTIWVESLSRNIEFRIHLKSDKSCDLNNYFIETASGDTLYNKGFSGSWSTIVDTVTLFPKLCFKGDTSGVKKVNVCTEDFGQEYYKLVYVQNTLRVGNGSAQITYVKY